MHYACQLASRRECVSHSDVNVKTHSDVNVFLTIKHFDHHRQATAARQQNFMALSERERQGAEGPPPPT